MKNIFLINKKYLLLYTSVFFSLAGILVSTTRIVNITLITISLFINLINYLNFEKNKKNIIILTFFFSIFLLSYFNLIISTQDFRYKYKLSTILVTYSGVLFSYLNYLIFYFIILNLYKKSNNLNFLYIIVTMIVISRFTNIYIFDDLKGYDGRYYLGFYLILFVPIFFSMIVYAKNRIQKTLSYVNAMFLFLIVLKCFTLYAHRGPLILLLILLLYILIRKPSLKSIFLSLIFVFSTIIYIKTYLMIDLDLIDLYIKRFTFVYSLEFNDGSSLSRIGRYFEMINMYISSKIPLLGFGPGASELYTNIIGSHTSFAGFFFDVGLLGFILYNLIIVVPAVNYKVKTDMDVVYKGSFYILCIYSLFYYSPPFPSAELIIMDFQLLGIIVLTYLNKKNNE